MDSNVVESGSGRKAARQRIDFRSFGGALSAKSAKVHFEY